MKMKRILSLAAVAALMVSCAGNKTDNSSDSAMQEDSAMVEDSVKADETDTENVEAALVGYDATVKRLQELSAKVQSGDAKATEEYNSLLEQLEGYKKTLENAKGNLTEAQLKALDDLNKDSEKVIEKASKVMEKANEVKNTVKEKTNEVVSEGAAKVEQTKASLEKGKEATVKTAEKVKETTVKTVDKVKEVGATSVKVTKEAVGNIKEQINK